MVCFGCCLSGTMLCIFLLVLKSIYVKYVKEYIYLFIYDCYSYICLKLFCSNDQLIIIKEKDKGVKINDDVRSNTIVANIIKF